MSWTRKRKIFYVITYLGTKSFKTVSAKFRWKFMFNNYSKKNVDAVRDSVKRSPKKSPRRRSQELILSRTSLQRILKKDLQLYPYRIQIKNKLKLADMEILVSVINHYHINCLDLFWDTQYIYCYKFLKCWENCTYGDERQFVKKILMEYIRTEKQHTTWKKLRRKG